MTRNFIREESNKFWTIKVEGKSITVISGKSYGAGPKSTNNSFPTIEKCEKEAEKLIAAKLKDDYKEVILYFPDVSVFVLKRVEEAIKNKVTELNVDINGSTGLLKEICTIVKLKKLELKNVKDLPEEICNLINLEILEIDQIENLQSIPEQASLMTNLKELKLQNIKVLPEEIGRLNNLEKLEILYCWDLQSIPKAIGQLTKLKLLKIENASVKSLPDEIGNLTELKRFDINTTQIKSLPPAVGQLSSLEELYISFTDKNSELHIPEEIGELKKLKRLMFQSNNLKTIPTGIFNLENLTLLDFRFNKIESLPIELFSMKNLESLNFMYNPISELPKDICSLPKLNNIALFDCPIKNVPKEIINEGAEVILDYLNGTKKTKKEADSINPDIVEQTVIIYKDRIDEFYRKAKSKIYEDVSKKTLEELITYLTGKSNAVPLIKSNDQYYFEHIIKIFAPFKEWTFVDRRILTYITQKAWYIKDNTGFYKEFYSWLEDEIDYRDYDGLYLSVINELKKNGIDEELIFKHSLLKLYSSILNKNESATSYGQYLISIMDSKIDKILNMAKEKSSIRNNIMILFLKYKEKEFEKYVPELIVIDKYKGEDGDSHIPYNALSRLCRINPQKFEQYVLNLMPQADCVTCIAEAGRILKDNYKDKYNDKVFEIAKNTLKYICEKRNKDRHYKFAWSLAEYYTDGTPEYIDWILKNYGKQAKDIIFKYVEDTVDLDLEVTKVVVEHLGQDAINIAGEALNMTIKSNDIAGHYRQLFTILSNLDYSKYYDKVWEIAKSEFKEVRQTACLALSKLDGKIVIPKAKELLDSKKANEREAGVIILSLLKTAESKKILEYLLDTEKNDVIRNYVVNLFYGE